MAGRSGKWSAAAQTQRASHGESVSARLYMDVHVPLPITVGLRLRGVEVITAQEDGTARFPDPDLLESGWRTRDGVVHAR